METKVLRPPLSFTKHPFLMRPLPQKCIPYWFSQHASKLVKVQLILVKKRTCSLKQTTLQAPLLDNVLFRNDTHLGVSQVQIRRKPFLHQYIMFPLTWPTVYTLLRIRACKHVNWSRWLSQKTETGIEAVKPYRFMKVLLIASLTAETGNFSTAERLQLVIYFHWSLSV